METLSHKNLKNEHLIKIVEYSPMVLLLPKITLAMNEHEIQQHTSLQEQLHLLTEKALKVNGKCKEITTMNGLSNKENENETSKNNKI